MKYKLTSLQLAGNKYVDEANAVLALLNEHYHTDIKMEFTQATRGHAKVNFNWFSVPVHAINGKQAVEYTWYYVVHEFVHINFRIHNHDSKFKTHEKKLLRLFGLDIKYARAYPRALYANGNKVYSKE